MVGVPCEIDLEEIKQEALKYAKMFGDVYIQHYEEVVGS